MFVAATLLSLIPNLPRSFTDFLGQKVLIWLTNLESTKPEDVMDYDDKEDVIINTFLNQFHRQIKYPMYIFLILVTFLLLNIRCNWVSPQALGLMFDLTGAAFLALGIVRGKCGLARDTRETRARVGLPSHGGIHVPQLRSNVQDSINGISGIFLITFGFAIQLIAILDIV